LSASPHAASQLLKCTCKPIHKSSNTQVQFYALCYWPPGELTIIHHVLASTREIATPERARPLHLVRVKIFLLYIIFVLSNIKALWYARTSLSKNLYNYI
jgi:hypothetical protein